VDAFQLEGVGTLRPMADTDVVNVLEWRNAPKVRSNMYSQHEISIEEHRLWWERTKTSEKSLYLVYEREEIPLGVVAFTEIEDDHKTASWAFYASPTEPKGTGRRMEVLALELAFSEPLSLRKLSCEVLSTNTPVIKLHKSFGFKTEGVFIEHKRIGGELVDVHRLTIFQNDWRLSRCDHLPRVQSN